MADWQVEDIDQGLAADFDGSLSGLGVVLETDSYNMSEALLALPNLPTFKEEEVDENEAHQGSCSRNLSDNASSTSTVSSIFNVRSTPNADQNSSIHEHYQDFTASLINQDRYQYVLGAATSIATKLHEETLTYLNQGQSYEIKFKKLGDVTEFRGKMLKSIIRVNFHERRLQYVAKEQLEHWQMMRPGEKIVELDVPLSYGIFDINSDGASLNSVSFCWDPTKETGVFVKLNCISTEFTPKKHGGEKGVPFRIVIETYSAGSSQRLNCASCQVKVFKPKGADRKHKTDREKMEKRSDADQGKYQQSYDCTVLTDSSTDPLYSQQTPITTISPTNDDHLSHSPNNVRSSTPQAVAEDQPKMKMMVETSNESDQELNSFTLTSDANAQQTAQWLQLNRFSYFVTVFSNFSGSDILRLSRDDFIQICGLADGIRLHNALHSTSIKPKLSLYVCNESEHVYHALYLENLSCSELVTKLSPLVGIHEENIHDMYIQGPNGIHVLVSDEVIHNINNESMFIIDLIKDQATKQVRILLKTP